MMFNNDNFFSWPRFRAYFMKIMKEHWKSNLTLTVLMFAAMLIMVMWASMHAYSPYYNGLSDDCCHTIYDPMDDAMVIIVTFFLYVCGCIWSARLMRGFKSKGGRIALLTTPVTQFESWFTRWIIHVPCFWIAFAVVVFAVDLVRVAVFSPIVAGAPVEMFHIEDDFFYNFILLFYLLTSSLYALGGVFFSRRPVLMTSVVLFFAGFIYAIVLFFMFFGNFDLGVSVVLNLLRAYMVAATLFCWWLSYRRYKELEIIDRM